MNQRFVSNKLKCKNLRTTTDDNTNANNDDDGSQVMTIAHITFVSATYTNEYCIIRNILTIQKAYLVLAVMLDTQMKRKTFKMFRLT
jgi:hypothetical protein